MKLQILGGSGHDTLDTENGSTIEEIRAKFDEMVNEMHAPAFEVDSVTKEATQIRSFPNVTDLPPGQEPKDIIIAIPVAGGCR